MSCTTAEPLQAHCRRVAGWATHLAHQLECSTEEVAGLEKAALLHHYPAVVLHPDLLTHLATDLNVNITEGARLTGTWIPILQVFHGMPIEQTRAAELARILEWADQLDEQFEFQALDPMPLEIQNEIFAAMPKLQIIDAAGVLRAGQALPVFPTVAQRAMRLLANEEVALDQLETLIGRDQVLTVELLKAANSALSGARNSIATVAAAIARIGVGDTVRVITAACLRPVFASRNLHDLWNHSLEAAQIAERFAIVSEKIDPAEAFLAGLIHDIGRLAYSLLSCNYQAKSQHLFEYGCQPLLVEKALTGTSHADIGGELLRSWALPPKIVEAVKAHHEMEPASMLAALLYVTEFWTMSDEDLPSFVKLDRALKLLDLPMQLLTTARPRMSPTLGHLALKVA